MAEPPPAAPRSALENPWLRGALALVVLAALLGAFLAVRAARDDADDGTTGVIEGSPAPSPPAGVNLGPLDSRAPLVGQPAPDFILRTADGATATLSDYRGEVVFVNFWATWCPPCRDEIPDLIKLQQRYKDHLLIIGVSSDEGPVDGVSRFVAEHNMNYPVVMETAELGANFPGIYALPTTFTLDQNMRMVQKHIGRLNPATVELETRYLAKLPVDADVEEVAAAADGALANQAQATDVPGLKLETLNADQKVAALKQLNEEKCDCGCGLTLAQCRINDPSCTASLPIAEKIVAEARKK